VNLESLCEFLLRFEQGGQRVHANVQPLFGELVMDLAFLYPTTQNCGFDSRREYRILDEQYSRTLPALVAPGGRQGATLSGESGFRSLDDDFARHFLPPFQNGPPSG
jgi:hypothetical protein